MPGIPRLDLDACFDHEMLLIVEAFQGSRSSLRGSDGVGRQGESEERRLVCQYAVGDCVEPVTSEHISRLSNSCVGRSSCSVAVDVGWMYSCNSLADYSQVVYQCIPSSFCLTVLLRLMIVPGIMNELAMLVISKCSVQPQ